MVAVICSKCGKPMPDAKDRRWPCVCRDCQRREEGVEALAPPSRDERSVPSLDSTAVGHFLAPTKLAPRDYYLICDHHDIVARWENDRRGWMLHRRDGFVRARHVADEIPWFGEFVLIDIGVELRGDGTHLTHVRAFKLQEEFALMRLVKSDTAILGTITGPAVLDDRQKDLVRDFVKSKYLRHVWRDSDELLEKT